MMFDIIFSLPFFVCHIASLCFFSNLVLNFGLNFVSIFQVTFNDPIGDQGHRLRLLSVSPTFFFVFSLRRPWRLAETEASGVYRALARPHIAFSRPALHCKISHNLFTAFIYTASYQTLWLTRLSCVLSFSFRIQSLDTTSVLPSPPASLSFVSFPQVFEPADHRVLAPVCPRSLAGTSMKCHHRVLAIGTMSLIKKTKTAADLAGSYGQWEIWRMFSNAAHLDALAEWVEKWSFAFYANNSDARAFDWFPGWHGGIQLASTRFSLHAVDPNNRRPIIWGASRRSRFALGNPTLLVTLSGYRPESTRGACRKRHSFRPPFVDRSFLSGIRLFHGCSSSFGKAYSLKWLEVQTLRVQTLNFTNSGKRVMRQKDCLNREKSGPRKGRPL